MIVTSILIVEDETIVAKDIQNRLKKFGYNISGITSTGEEAIRKVIETKPDLILMDIRLKGNIDGVEAAQEIHNNFQIPIIYLTANADDSTLERVKATNPFGYIIKPFKEKELRTIIEITLARHRVERKLQQSEQWLTTVLKSIGDAVIVSDRTGKITFMNPVAETLTGWKQEEAFGKNATEIFNITHEKTRKKFGNPIIQALEKGVIVSLPEQTILTSKNNVEIPIDDSAAPIKDNNGNITGAVLAFRDITERKQAEEIRIKQLQQERLIAELEKLNELKDDFLSTVSHELRTPIANMKMAIQMLKLSPTIERSQRYLDILQNECARESEMINGLLDLQRLETASYPMLLNDSVNLQDWLTKIVDSFRVRSQQRQQIIKFNLPPNLQPTVTDRASLERILAELLNNACKYTPDGGEIVLSVAQKKSEGKNFPNSSTIFTISNQAEIPIDQLPRIFEKFYRVPKADRWKQGGTGLGLALVQKLLERLQGTIHVESSEGWTTFTIELFQLLCEVTECL